MEIKTRKGQTILIDDEDFENLSKFKWCIKNNGDGNLYAVANINKKQKAMHRYLLNITDSKQHVDHINGNSLDNRKTNLRICINAENRRNAKKNKRNTSGYKGVRTRKNIDKYAAYVHYEGKFYHLGYYDTAIEAAKVRDAKAKELHGKFAKLNFPEVTDAR